MPSLVPGPVVKAPFLEEEPRDEKHGEEEGRKT
jgi:hypothetical protein